MNRRDFLKYLLATPIAMQMDVEKLLWVPGEKKIFLPEPHDYKYFVHFFNYQPFSSLEWELKKAETKIYDSYQQSQDAEKKFLAKFNSGRSVTFIDRMDGREAGKFWGNLTIDKTTFDRNDSDFAYVVKDSDTMPKSSELLRPKGTITLSQVRTDYDANNGKGRVTII